MVPRLIDRAHELGFEITIGDAYRDPRCPYGSKSSRHKADWQSNRHLIQQVRQLVRFGRVVHRLQDA